MKKIKKTKKTKAIKSKAQPKTKRKHPPKPSKKTYKPRKAKKQVKTAIVVAKPAIAPSEPKQEKGQYFTKVHEDAILAYASSTDNNRKTELYMTLIQPVFNEMVEKIVYTYKFNSLPNIDDLKNECKIFLTTILDKYDTSRGSKAFSYFSVITKNWFIHKVKKNNNKKEVYIEDIKDSPQEEELVYEESYLSNREKEEFWSALDIEMNGWFDKRLKENEIKVYKAIIMLFKECDSIEIFNKKAIYLYMREITGLNTKQVVNNLKKFRNKYDQFRENWENGKVTHVNIEAQAYEQ